MILANIHIHTQTLANLFFTPKSPKQQYKSKIFGTQHFWVLNQNSILGHLSFGKNTIRQCLNPKLMPICIWSVNEWSFVMLVNNKLNKKVP